MHGIGEEALGTFGASSKMNNDWAFLRHLHEIGWHAADRWLEENHEAVAGRSTLDLSGLVPPKDAPLMGPSVIKQIAYAATAGGRPPMKIEDVRRTAYAMPLTNPSFPRGPYRFFDREYLIITYRTDPEALRAVVPEPLEVVEPLVKYEFIRMPNSTGFGDYTELGQVIPLRFDGEHGVYVHSMYLDDDAPIAGGRELWGFEKARTVRRSAMKARSSSARCTTARCSAPRPPWATSIARPTRMPSWRPCANPTSC